jgi:hypothetical protein
MWAILIGLVVISVLMSVTALSTRTVAVTRTKAEGNGPRRYATGDEGISGSANTAALK